MTLAQLLSAYKNTFAYKKVVEALQTRESAAFPRCEVADGEPFLAVESPRRARLSELRARALCAHPLNRRSFLLLAAPISVLSVLSYLIELPTNIAFPAQAFCAGVFWPSLMIGAWRRHTLRRVQRGFFHKSITRRTESFHIACQTAHEAMVGDNQTKLLLAIAPGLQAHPFSPLLVYASEQGLDPELAIETLSHPLAPAALAVLQHTRSTSYIPEILLSHIGCLAERLGTPERARLARNLAASWDGSCEELIAAVDALCV